ncbi:hypothetical protein ABW19_dt0202547 [Dactylella cylindrospora]|nr:hypothetical protein ABW19_dt0202547 [Dactylella cylindrospora]
MDPEKNMTTTAPSDDEYVSDEDRRSRSRSRRRGPRRNRGKPSGASQALQPVSELGNEVSKATGQVTDTVSGATGAVSGVASGLTGGGGGQKKDTLRLRLDLNLDVEVTLKARIHGDLELALLDPEETPFFFVKKKSHIERTLGLRLNQAYRWISKTPNPESESPNLPRPPKCLFANLASTRGR